MKRFFVASAFALFCVGLASAQQDIVSARIALMKANAKSDEQGQFCSDIAG